MDSISSALNTFNGFVEVKFSIKESPFNQVHSNETEKSLHIRRSVHANQNDYAIDGVLAERVDVKNLFQTYGFADYYPFQYSIQCNDITSVEESNAKDRLQWLKCCCGVDEYLAKKNKSLRVLRETEDHIRKIDESLEKIDVQLAIFGSNENQQIYQRFVNRERELGHMQRTYRIKKIRSDIESLDSKVKSLSNRITAVKDDTIKCTSNAAEIRREIKTMVEQIHVLNTNEQQLQHDIDEYERAKVELVEYIANLRNTIEKGALAEELTANEKRLYEVKIDETRTRLSEIDAQIDVIDERKAKIESELAELEQQAEAIVLNCQQNQRLGKQFASIVQRNEYLSGQIKKLKTVISRESRKQSTMLAELQREIKKLEDLKTTAEQYNQQLTEMNATEETNSFYQQQEMITSLEDQKL